MTSELTREGLQVYLVNHTRWSDTEVLNFFRPLDYASGIC